MFQPTHPKSRAQKELRTVELQLLDWYAQLEMANCNVNMLERRAARLDRYIANYNEADPHKEKVSGFTSLPDAHQIPQAF